MGFFSVTPTEQNFALPIILFSLHLQDILEFKNDRKVKILDFVSGNESIYRRLVDLYYKSNDSDSYKLIGNSIELCTFLSEFLQLEVQLEKSVSANNQSSMYNFYYISFLSIFLFLFLFFLFISF